jgi:phosphatidylglycerol:prolipoprotein diacylglycerol transferase
MSAAIFAHLVGTPVPFAPIPTSSGAGIPIDMNPVMAQLGPLTVTWHGLFTAVGVLAGILLAIRLAPRVNLSEDTIQAAAWWAVIAGIIGARLLYAWENAPVFAHDPAGVVTGITEGGLSIYGAIIGGIAGLIAFCIKNKVSFGRLADVGAPGLILGMAIGRIGDVINGEHWGEHWTGSGGLITGGPGIIVRYVNLRTQGQLNVPVHLAVGYELILDLVVFGALLYLFRRGWKVGTGALLGAFLIGYSLDRLIVSPYRLPTATSGYWIQIGGLALRQAQALAILGILIGAGWIGWILNQPATAEGMAEPLAAEGESAPAQPVASGDAGPIPAGVPAPGAAAVAEEARATEPAAPKRPRRATTRGRAAVPPESEQ